MSQVYAHHLLARLICVPAVSPVLHVLSARGSHEVTPQRRDTVISLDRGLINYTTAQIVCAGMSA